MLVNGFVVGSVLGLPVVGPTERGGLSNGIDDGFIVGDSDFSMNFSNSS